MLCVHLLLLFFQLPQVSLYRLLCSHNVLKTALHPSVLINFAEVMLLWDRQ
jgi:hypothetical protein